MKLTHHTPGPWHMMETEPGIVAEMDVFVTTPRWAGGTGLIARVMNADDALLIKAAPDLLEALQTIMAEVAGCERNAKWEAARAAIFKATKGESK